MGKTRLTLIALFVLAAATACVHGRPTPAQLATADYGPFPSDYETIVKNYYSKSLFDPYSAVYEFAGPPKQGWAAVPRGSGALGELVRGYEPVFGWEVQGRINAKNRLGGYVGGRPFILLIRDGRVIKAVGP